MIVGPETNVSLHFMEVSDIMNDIPCSQGKRHLNSKERAQEVLLQVSDLGKVFRVFHFTD